MSNDTSVLLQILDVLRDIRAELRAGGTPRSEGASNAPSGKGGKVAGERELDSEWGNPQVRKDPRNWKGGSFVGCRFSECPPEYLEDVAELFDWMADKDEQEGRKTPDKPGKPGRPTAPYKRSDASRARGWAQRIRNGWKPTAPPAESGEEPPTGVTDDDIPF